MAAAVINSFPWFTVTFYFVLNYINKGICHSMTNPFNTQTTGHFPATDQVLTAEHEQQVIFLLQTSHVSRPNLPDSLIAARWPSNNSDMCIAPAESPTKPDSSFTNQHCESMWVWKKNRPLTQWCPSHVAVSSAWSWAGQGLGGYQPSNRWQRSWLCWK